MPVAASDWFPWAITEDVTRPFRPHNGITDLSDAEMDALRTAFAQDGLGTRAAPVGRKIADTSYSWLGSACIGGAFHFQAWEYPDTDYTGLRFPEMLFAKDPTGIRIEPSPTDGTRRVCCRNQAGFNQDKSFLAYIPFRSRPNTASAPQIADLP